MPTYRAKPIEIDAVKLPERLSVLSIQGHRDGEAVRQWFKDRGGGWRINFESNELIMEDEQGVFIIYPGEYVIFRGNGDFNGMPSDRFEEMYEPV